MHVFHIPSQILNLFLSSSQLGSMDPKTQNTCNLPEASDPVFLHILGSFAFLGYVRLSSFVFFFGPSSSSKQIYTMCPFVPLLNYLSFSFFLAALPPLQSFSDQGNVLSKLQLRHQEDECWLTYRFRIESKDKGEFKEMLK